MTDFFIDFSAAGGGNGSSATPWNRISNITGTTANDVVWLRRVAYTDTTLALGLGTSIPSGVPIVGWPKTGDSRYSVRPVSMRSAWDGDVLDYATINHTPGSAIGTVTPANIGSLIPASGASYILSRLKIIHYAFAANDYVACIGAYSTTSGVGFPTGTYTFNTEQCWFEAVSTVTSAMTAAVASYSQQGLTSVWNWTDKSSYFIATTSLAQRTNGLYVPGNASFSASVYNMSCYGSVFRATSGSDGYPIQVDTANLSAMGISGIFDSCTFESASPRTVATYGLLYTTTSCSFVRCQFISSAGIASGRNRFNTGNCRFLQCDFININSVTVDSVNGTLNIRRFIQGAADTGQAALSAGGSGVVYAGYTDFRTGNLFDIDVGIASGSIGTGSVFVRSISEGTGNYAVRYGGRIAIGDINGVVGSWRRYTVAGIAEVVGSRRRGSQGRFAYRLTPSNAQEAAVLGVPTAEAGFDTTTVLLQPGTNTVTIYGAHTGYSLAPTMSSVWADVEVPLLNRIDVVSTLIDDQTSLPSNASTWDSIGASYTAFSLTITVTADVRCIAYVRTYAAKYGGSVYIDPEPVVS